MDATFHFLVDSGFPTTTRTHSASTPPCTLYNVSMVHEMIGTAFSKMKIPCKVSETYYGVPVVEHTDDNATM